MPKLMIEKIQDKKTDRHGTYGKDMYKVVKLIDSDRLHLLSMQYDEPSMKRFLQSLPATYKYEINKRCN